LANLGDAVDDRTVGDRVLVGRASNGHRLRHLHGDLHPMLRHPHSFLKSKLAKESAFHRNTQATSEIVTTKGR